MPLIHGQLQQEGYQLSSVWKSCHGFYRDSDTTTGNVDDNDSELISSSDSSVGKLTFITVRNRDTLARSLETSQFRRDNPTAKS
ncbi:MAG: hypothetical protein Q9168_007639 [Polycauliona sp. 1 TL-2023]